jgi:RHH-type proline utilization regulon transcriptional repressor/proline dehydrogenase/delta 1-pyrroline-5-carboxylate dehydrogenase
LHARLPQAVRQAIDLVPEWTAPNAAFDAVLHHGDAASLLQTGQALAARPGPIVSMGHAAGGSTAVPLERLVIERALSVNTAAAGGNASLMTIA